MATEVPYEAAYLRAAQLLGQAMIERSFLEEEIARLRGELPDPKTDGEEAGT